MREESGQEAGDLAVWEGFVEADLDRVGGEHRGEGVAFVVVFVGDALGLGESLGTALSRETLNDASDESRGLSCPYRGSMNARSDSRLSAECW